MAETHKEGAAGEPKCHSRKSIVRNRFNQRKKEKKIVICEAKGALMYEMLKGE